VPAVFLPRAHLGEHSAMTQKQKMTRHAIIVLVLGAAIMGTSFGIRQTFGLFMGPITSDLTISREVFGFAVALQNLLWGLTQPLAGMVADKFGFVRVIILGSLCYVAGLVLLTMSSSQTEIYLSFGLLVGFGLSGTTFAVVLGAVGRAVPAEKRSMALGIASAGGSFGMFAFVPAGNLLLNELGWVTSFLCLAAMAATMPLLAIGFRKGGSNAVENAEDDHQAMLPAISEASRHSGYLLLTAGFFVCGFHLAFVVTHLPSYLMDHGIDRSIGAWALALVGFANIIGTYVCGALGGRYRKKHLLAILYLLRAAIVAVFILVPLSATSALVFGAISGLVWLGTVPLTSGLVGQIFGPRYLATLFGFVFFSHQVGSFLGAWLGGVVFEQTGSYQPIWIATIVLSIVAAVLHMPITDAPLRRPSTGMASA
jgi:predicted MFS family arabinose efflux permease